MTRRRDASLGRSTIEPGAVIRGGASLTSVVRTPSASMRQSRARSDLLPTVVLMGISLAACSSLPPVRDTMGTFDQAAHTVSTEQMTFLGNVRAIDCQLQFLDTALTYAKGSGGIDLRGNCAPRVPTTAEVQIRENLMNSIVLYVDQLQAITLDGDHSALDQNAQTAAGTINAFAAHHGLSKLSVAADVESAVIELTNVVLDRQKIKTVRTAASKEQEALEKVVATLVAENTSLAAEVQSNIGTMRADLASVLARIRQQQHEAVFFDVIEARRMLFAAGAFGSSTPTLSDLGTSAVPLSNIDDTVSQLNAALQSLSAANKALATSGPGGLAAAVNELAARAKAAGNLQSALDK